MDGQQSEIDNKSLIAFIESTEKENLSKIPNILIYTDKSQTYDSLRATVASGKIASPAAREITPQNLTHASAESDTFFMSKNGVYWSGGYSFIFNEADVLSTHQFIDSQVRGTRIFSENWNGNTNTEPATLDINEHPCLILCDSNKYFAVKRELERKFGPEWFKKRYVDPQEIHTEARKFCSNYYQTNEGKTEMSSIQNMFRQGLTEHPNDEYFASLVTTWTKSPESAIETIINNGGITSDGDILRLFQTDTSTDVEGHSLNPNLAKIETLLSEHMVDWLKKKHFEIFSNELPNEKFVSKDTGTRYNEIPLSKMFKVTKDSPPLSSAS